MIHFINASIILSKRDGGKQLILEPTTLSIPTNACIGIWDEGGKTTSVLLELITGALPLIGGRIVRSTRLSPPISLSHMIQPKLSGLDNIAFMARTYGEDIDKTIDLVDKFSELGSVLENSVKTYDAGMRARLGLSISFSMPFDCYLVDTKVLAGPMWFREKCKVFLQGPGSKTGVLLVSSRVKELKEHCGAFLIYRNQKLVPVASLDTAD